jgi:asparagine N-glycosylation enzyme membrane subunit Stt3
MPAPTTIVRYFDVVLVVVGVIVALALGAPVFGALMGGGAWILQRAVQANDRALISRLPEPRQQLAANLGEAFGRIWLLAIAIIVAGVAGHRSDGLTAALVIFGAYSIFFIARLLSGSPKERRGVNR